MLEHFNRQADSTHVVIYGTPAGELLASYWPGEDKAISARVAIKALARRVRAEGEYPNYDPNPRVDSLAELDALAETGEEGYGNGYQ